MDNETVTNDAIVVDARLDDGNRDKRGMFVHGNKLGRGNPALGKIERLRHQLLEATDEAKVVRVWNKAIAMAEDGDAKARKFVFEWLFGKVPQPIITAKGDAHLTLVMDVMRGNPDALARINELAKLASTQQGMTDGADDADTPPAR